MKRPKRYGTNSRLFSVKPGQYDSRAVLPIGTPDDAMRGVLMVDRDPLILRIERLLAPVARRVRYGETAR